MKSNKEARVVYTVLGIFFILGGAYSLSQGDIGWASIIIGAAVIGYIAITGKV